MIQRATCLVMEAAASRQPAWSLDIRRTWISVAECTRAGAMPVAAADASSLLLVLFLSGVGAQEPRGASSF
jgi:hypothetical protein